ncbi:ABC transporter substrate-binding protein [Planctomicrobium piriforme]|uniref:Peptide/nickel transport system substrate-binding protein n=1 Tax=Planctomicrobium piriforme TaxID=1576369 RepID=A0A1I3GW59_9PLAN|nr:ABC transporter substrate-binding protein [Planctomicrobium piriforme]SFI27600.1 peptide/nickel transport system substrate-binding protein [Planctomicrobium piriforme]
MMDCRRCLLAVSGGLLLALLSGCPGPSSESESGSTTGNATDAKGATVFPGIEPFTPPSLAELDAMAEWESQPVIDSMQAFRELKAKEPELVTVAEALKLQNKSDEDNKKILSALGRPAADDKDVNFDAEFKRHMKGDINSTNPILFSSTSDLDVNGLTGIGFFNFNWKLEPFAPAETVVSWQSSKNKLYDKVVIRDDLVWSDGKPITAYDVAFSFQTIMNPEVPVPAVRTGTDKIRWVEAYDDHTFVIFHKEALATNVWNCNYPIIPKHIYEKSLKDDLTLTNSDYHQKFEQNPVCGGPFKVTKRVKGQEIILERRDDWYMQDGKQVRAKPNYRQVRFRIIDDMNTALLAVKDGQLEEMELQPRQWIEQTNDDAFYSRNTKARGVQWVYFYFGWNMRTPYFSDLKVREAMSYAVNYEQILGKLNYGLYEQATGEFPQGNWAAPKVPRAPYKQDLAKSEKLLAEAGWVDTDGDGIRDKTISGQKVKFEFGVMCANEQSRIDICTSLAESLSRLGISCNVQPTEFTVLQQRAQEHQFQAMLGGWGTGTDPSTTENLWKTGETRNYTGYSNAKVDELFGKGLREFDQEKRADIYREIDDILWADQPYTWLYYRSAFFGFNKSLRGYMFSPRGPFHYSPGFDSFWSAKSAP